MAGQLEREQWGGKLAYILSSVGFSVGLGTFWRFPPLVGEYGGGSFLVPFIIITIMIGFPMLLLEAAFGRRIKANPVVGISKIVKSNGIKWTFAGWFPVITSILLMSYYILMTGWMLYYFILMTSGKILTLEIGELRELNQLFTADVKLNLILYFVVVIILGTVVSKGIKKGIEKVCKYMLPLLLAILLTLFVRTLLLPGSVNGLKWFFHFDKTLFTWEVLLAALGQSFFSIGIGVSTAIVYGSYLDDEVNLVKDCGTVVVFILLIAMLIGSIIFMAVFAFGLKPAEGPALIFIIMPYLFSKMPMGNLFGSLFFIAIFLAGILPGIGYLEAVTSAFSEKFSLSRRLGTFYALVAISLLGIFSILSFGPLKEFKILEMTIFTFLDYLTGNILMPVNSILLLLFLFRKWGLASLQKEVFKQKGTDLNIGSKSMYVYWFVFLLLLVILYFNF